MGREGRCWKFGDNIPADQIVEADGVLLSIEEMAKHVLENLNPELPKHIRKGDILMAGKHFGQSSGRAMAPKAIKATGVGAVITEYASRLSYRNCSEIGLPLLECGGITQRVSDGDILYVNMESGIIVNKTTGREFRARPIDPFLMGMLEAGGLIALGPRIGEYQIQEFGGDTASKIKGRVWKFGDNTPMDQIVGVDRALDDMEGMARHVLENYNPEFPKKVQKGDTLVAGKHFDQSSGRAVAPKAIKATGARAVVVEYASGLFYRNAFEVELPLMECPGITDHVSDGDCLSVGMTIGKIKNETTGDVLQARPVDLSSVEVLEAGGLIAFGPRIDQWNVWSMTASANFIIFWCLSFLGYMTGRRLKVSAPAILGPVACFMVLALSSVHLSVPAFQKPMLSVATGVLLGLRINHSLEGVYRQIIVYVAWFILLSPAGICILTVTGVDRETAFFAAIPGGMAETTLMSFGYRSDPFVTVLLQSPRMLISMTFFSSLAARYHKKDPEEKKMDHLKGKGMSLPLWYLLIVLSLARAGIFGLLHMPTTTILAPMMVVGTVVRGAGLEYRINRNLQTLVQIGIGGLTEASVSRESMMGFPHYIIPIILLSLLVTGNGIPVAHLLMKLTQQDKITCILSCCPAGLLPTIMVVMEYGADADIVTIFQVLRMVTALLMTPVLAWCLPLFIQMP